MRTKTRYFIVSYGFPDGFGNVVFIGKNGDYVNKERIKEELQKDGVKEFAILNIIELSELDYKDYIKTDAP